MFQLTWPGHFYRSSQLSGKCTDTQTMVDNVLLISCEIHSELCQPETEIQKDTNLPRDYNGR